MKRKDEFSGASNEMVRRKVEYIYQRYQFALLDSARRWKHGQSAPFYGFDAAATKAESERLHHHLHANLAAMYSYAIAQLAHEFDFPPPKAADNRPPPLPGIAQLRIALESDLQKATGREVRL